MNELVKSGILGIVTIIMLFVGAYFTNEMEETTIERSLNIKKKVVKVDAIVENNGTNNINSKNSEATF